MEKLINQLKRHEGFIVLFFLKKKCIIYHFPLALYIQWIYIVIKG